LYQKASQIAEILSDTLGEDGGEGYQRSAISDEENNADDDADVIGDLPDGPGFGLGRIRNGGEGPGDAREDSVSPDSIVLADAPSSSTAVLASAGGRKRTAPLNWSLIGRLTRAMWEKSMASCCLGMVLQHRCASNLASLSNPSTHPSTHPRKHAWTHVSIHFA
jgi:hypothetical protein